jgi:hypothetical protein
VKHIITTLFVVASSSVARADECRATAVLDGDGVLVDTIDSTLRERGIATKATAACPTTTALVERRDNAIAVTITDPYGRRSTRTLEDVDAAASLIETWARQDMNASALVGWIEPAQPAMVDAPRIDAVTTRAATPHERVRDPLTLAVAGETSLGFDGTPWLGARATACVRVGPVCAGANARILSNESRRSIDLLAGVELPIALSRRVVFVTGASAGAGSFRAPFFRGEVMTKKSLVGVRLDARASLAISLSRYVGLHVGVSVGGSPQAPMTTATDGDSIVDNDEPRGFVRADIGLRIGVP